MSETLANLMTEDRSFPPNSAFVAQANAQPGIHEAADADWLGWWDRNAKQRLTWFKEPTVVLDDSNPPFFKWFSDGELNVSYNCLDRHVEAGGGDKAAFIWEGEPGDKRTLTYSDLLGEVCRFANVLDVPGRHQGRPRRRSTCRWSPSSPIAMLACARIGAIHSVVFGGFSAESLARSHQRRHGQGRHHRRRGWRRGNRPRSRRPSTRPSPRHRPVEHVDRARTHRQRRHDERRPRHLVARPRRRPSDACPPAVMDAEDPLFILYTSGTTGKPKGIVHTTGGYLAGATTDEPRRSSTCKDDDVYWCTADIGWITGHSYIVYGPLANGATGVMYEGAPNHPDQDRFWEIDRGLQGHDLLHGADRHSRLHQVGRRASEHATTSPRCGCWARSASRSIPKPGCGTTK